MVFAQLLSLPQEMQGVWTMNRYSTYTSLFMIGEII